MASSAESVPPISAGRFGLEQRCFYRHPDLYEEEVPEMDLETVLSRPNLGVGCAVRTFLLLGDQNAGKSTLLHSFCREGDPSFMQLSSLLPVLSSSFINTRLVPRSVFGDRDADLNKCISAVRDEMPFMDTDIARGIVMLTLENFVFFCNEFGIALLDKEAAGQADDVCELFGPEVRFVALQFVELGGDHLDRLLRFGAAGGDLGAVRAAEATSASDPVRGSAEDEAFWTDIHEVLLGSLKLLQATTRTVYFINCAVLFSGSAVSTGALRSMLRKLRFLSSTLGSENDSGDAAAGSGSTACEVMFYVSRAPAEVAADFDAAAAWLATRAEVIVFAREELGASLAASAARSLPEAPPPAVSTWEPDDEGLDLSALEEVGGSAAREWRAAEERAGPLLAFIREMVKGLVLPGLRSRLRLCGVYAVRNLVGDCGDTGGLRVTAGLAPSMEGQGQLCAPSVVRNVARLLQRVVSQAPADASGRDASLVPYVAELVLRCALQLRQIESSDAGAEAATVLGRWVTRADLAEHLEECEADNAAVPLPEVAALQCWDSAVQALFRCAVCSVLAHTDAGMPRIELNLMADCGSVGQGVLPTVRLKPAAADGAGSMVSPGTGDVIFVMGGRREVSGPRDAGLNAVGLPLDKDLFALLSSEASIKAVCAHLAGERTSGAVGTTGVGRPFRFLAPEAASQLRAARTRLRSELDRAVSQAAADVLSGAELTSGCLTLVLHKASDLWHAEALLGGDDEIITGPAPGPPAAKRACIGGEAAVSAAAVERLARALETAARLSDPEVCVELAEPASSDAPSSSPVSQDGSAAGGVALAPTPRLTARLPL